MTVTLRRCRAGALVAVLGAALLAPMASTPVEAAGASRAPTATRTVPTDRSFSVATYNIRHALSDAVAVSDVEKLADAGADVISMQEMGSGRRRSALRARLVDCASCGYGAAMPTGAGPGEIPILFRRSEMRYLGKGIQKVSSATYVGPNGAGPSTMGPKYLNYVELQHRATGQVLYVINSHSVPSVQARDGGPNYRNRKRVQLYRQHMAGLRALVARLSPTGAEVIATGDLNVNYRRDRVRQDTAFPYFNMRKVGMSASFKALGTPAAGTHLGRSGGGTRLIDYVAATTHPAVTPTRQRILMGYRSDHRPLLVTYGVAAAPGTATGVTAEPLERAARVSWTPAPDNGAPVTSYVVTSVPDGPTVTVPGTATAATVTGLTAGSTYSFVVRARSRLGSGPDSAESPTVTPFAVPPRTRITAGPRNGAFVTSGRALFRYTSDVARSSFSCEVDHERRACGAGSSALANLSQDTHTFSVTATDPSGDVDSSPATRSWTVPLDSRDLARSPRWSLHNGRSYYTGAYVTTTRRGATLRRAVVDTKALALVATTGPRHGSVRVYLGSKLLKRISLDSSVLHRRRVLPVAQFAEPVSGNVRVIVASAGRTVRVEGLGAARD